MTTSLVQVLPFARSSLFSFEGAMKQAACRLAENLKREKWMPASIAGADDAEVPPVPIPNTVVKLCCAEDTWLETTWENR